MNAPEENAWVYELAESISRAPKFSWFNESDRYDAAMDAAVNTIPHLKKFKPEKSGLDGIKGYAARIIFRLIAKTIVENQTNARRLREDYRTRFAINGPDKRSRLQCQHDIKIVRMTLTDLMKRTENFEDQNAEIIMQTLVAVYRLLLKENPRKSHASASILKRAA
jgi:hypothetical protein